MTMFFSFQLRFPIGNISPVFDFQVIVKKVLTYTANSVTSQAKEVDLAQQYIPRELAENFAAKQLQEHAWHIRQIMRTSFLALLIAPLLTFRMMKKKNRQRPSKITFESQYQNQPSQMKNPICRKLNKARMFRSLLETQNQTYQISQVQLLL